MTNESSAGLSIPKWQLWLLRRVWLLGCLIYPAVLLVLFVVLYEVFHIEFPSYWAPDWMVVVGVICLIAWNPLTSRGHFRAIWQKRLILLCLLWVMAVLSLSLFALAQQQDRFLREERRTYEKQLKLEQYRDDELIEREYQKALAKQLEVGWYFPISGLIALVFYLAFYRTLDVDRLTILVQSGKPQKLTTVPAGDTGTTPG